MPKGVLNTKRLVNLLRHLNGLFTRNLVVYLGITVRVRERGNGVS